jgi:hypothetical protein
MEQKPNMPEPTGSATEIPTNETASQAAPASPVQPISPAPSPQASPVAPPAQAGSAPETKKSNPWPWIVGGCLIVAILVIATVLILGWWGVRKVKKEIKESDAMQEFERNVEKAKKEGEEWEKKSEEYRESMPDPNDLSNQVENSYPSQK